MLKGFRAFTTAAVSVTVVAASLVIHADVTPTSQSSELQLQLAHEFFREGRYLDALDAYRNALNGGAPADGRAARVGVIQSSLRVAEFSTARSEAEALLAVSPKDPSALALHGDALWASGLFEEAEARYRDAVAAAPELARGLHGVARALAARSKLDEALTEAQAAIRHSPRDLEAHHTIGSIYERMRRFEDAAGSYDNYVNLLPNTDRSEKASWARAEVRFLRSFGERVPFEMEPGAADRTYTVDFRLVKDKIVVRAKVNKGSFQDFVVDTGAESTIISGPLAQKVGISPLTFTLSAGVGNAGLRGLQMARIDSLELGELKMRNVPCLIKDPPMRNLPVKEAESLSPLALGFSMVIDYRAKKLTFARRLEQEPADLELPLRMHRLATVRGMVDGRHTANFVVDTGGEVISISRATATAIQRPVPTPRIGLKVFGSSGWDRDAFLLPGVSLAFSTIKYDNFPVVVLNLNAPSALLGFELGGIVGHRFLSKYRVGIDLDRSVLRLKSLS
jgi:tetratricopeptide (TPR) repeat protein